VIVADANLIIYRYLRGPLSPTADAVVRRDGDWRTASLWRSEFTSAAVKMIRGRVISEADALAAMHWAAGEMIEREVDVPQERALRIALLYGVSGYDAQYAALADILGVRCVTADAALARKAPLFAVSVAEFVK
jgi:predicted nucleic acid-binding protein